MFGDTIKGTLRTLSSCDVTHPTSDGLSSLVCTDSVLVISPNGSNCLNTTLRDGRSGAPFSAGPTDSSLVQNFQTCSRVHSASYSEDTVFFTRQSGCGEKSSAHFRPMPRLRKSGSVPLLPLHKSHVFKRGSTTILPAQTPSFSGSLSRAVV